MDEARKGIVKIEALFERPGGRALSQAQPQPDPALLAEGWERRFTADAQRAKEAIELYELLGFEVRAESLRSNEFADGCEGCPIPSGLEYKTIYTRKKAS